MPSAADVVSRWHLVLSKYCLLARKLKLAPAQGTFDTSSAALMTPWFVVIVMPAPPSRSPAGWPAGATTVA